jgi:hypothetical protein
MWDILGFHSTVAAERSLLGYYVYVAGFVLTNVC